MPKTKKHSSATVNKKPTVITPATVKHIGQLARIPLTAAEEEKLAVEFAQTLAVVDELQTADVSGVEPTHQVTGLENVWREDVVDDRFTFTQAQALQNAKHTHHGYFVVNRLIDQD